MAKVQFIKEAFISPFILHQFASFSLSSCSPLRSPRSRNYSPCSPAAVSLSALVSFTCLGFFFLTYFPSSQKHAHCPPPLAVSVSSYGEIGSPTSAMAPLPVHVISDSTSVEEREFWKQPDVGGFRPCLQFTLGYRKFSARVSKERRRFLVVMVSGGLYQQRNQIVDAVVIARILEAAFVLPVLQVDHLRGDEKDFSDIFDAEHFKKILRADVRVVSSLPSTHLVSRQSVQTQIPLDVRPFWLRARFLKQLNEDGLLVLKDVDSKLSKNLPLDLQRLRCKVAFHALRFASPIMKLGNRLARRIWIEGPYIAAHLRLEKDVWMRTGCPTGPGPELDDIISREKSNWSSAQRRLAGPCPLNASEVARLLRALGAPKNATVYIAGGDPLGGNNAHQAVEAEFPKILTKEKLARGGELALYMNSSASLAAIDFTVSLSSDVFISSHGGNMARAMQGYRAYVGNRKFIETNKEMMLPLLLQTNFSDGGFRGMIRQQRRLRGQPEQRTNMMDKDVLAYPLQQCMCSR